VTLATESLGRPLLRAGRRTLPGASRSRVFDVSTTPSTVRSLLRLKESAWTMRIGRRKPGSDPRGSSRSAHHTSRRCTTTQPNPHFVPGRPVTPGRYRWVRRRRHRSVCPSHPHHGVWLGTPQQPLRKARFGTILIALPGRQQTQRGHLVVILLFSYRYYTTV